MREYLITRLNEEEEGRCTGDHFVICVMDMVDIGEGRVIPSSGNAEYTIKYRAIIWKPFRGETVRWKKKKYKLHETSAELFLLGLV
jgi:DNA-directed RNA polymerase II subunit RPB7